MNVTVSNDSRYGWEGALRWNVGKETTNPPRAWKTYTTYPLPPPFPSKSHNSQVHLLVLCKLQILTFFFFFTWTDSQVCLQILCGDPQLWFPLFSSHQPQQTAVSRKSALINPPAQRETAPRQSWWTYWSFLLIKRQAFSKIVLCKSWATTYFFVFVVKMRNRWKLFIEMCKHTQKYKAKTQFVQF